MGSPGEPATTGVSRRILMFHGSSSIHLEAIMKSGFDPDPTSRLSDLMADAGTCGHTSSFVGTYATTSLDHAASYARKAVEHVGGDPVIHSILVPVALLVPDEDEILYSMGYPVLHAMGWEEESAEEPGFELGGWTEEAALRVAQDLHTRFGAPDPDAVASMASAVHEMVSATVEGWDRDPELFHPEASDWSSPAWVRRLVSTPRGLAVYRSGMDALSTAMVGSDPDRYPCGFESCKGRVRGGVAVGSPTCPIVAIGSRDDIAALFDATGAIPEDAEMDSIAEEQLAERSVAPRFG